MPEEKYLNKTLAVVGDEDVVLGFRALGFKVYPVSGTDESKAKLEEIVQEKCAVCLIQESVYLAAEEEINKYKNLPLPVFIPFSKNSQTDLLKKTVRDIRLRATGAD